VPKSIAVVNQKGGVGKTTTAVNLAAGLGLAERPTLLIDLDPQGNATTGLGIQKSGLYPTVYHVLLGTEPLDKGIKPTAIPSLKILPSDIDLVGAEIELVPMIAREHRLAEALRSVRDSYEYVIIDCPPSLGLLTINGLTAADALLVPMQCEYYALEGLSALLETVDLIRQRLNPGLAIEGLLLTMFDTRNSLCHQVADELRLHFPHDVFTTVIPRNVRLSESPSHGLPAVVYDPTSRGAEAYQALARELLDRHAGRHPAAPAPTEGT